ncbi:hypothetical protein K435DRAFT_967939 [Dendrothele bispora CBS 962.96]|uniref:Uncharacterized protein n=1 Tax=Dendrothele bispora (strain CBS 962.96) TaxID=1314807 RepID=A0A4S8LR11_DENBC|nr:hypothetical protein K435DRAFT_967939 [Dendrothele bispora CBS 962.96]
MMPTPPPTGRKRPHCTRCHQPMQGHPRGTCVRNGTGPSRATSLPANPSAANIYPSFQSFTTDDTDSSRLSVISDDEKPDVGVLNHPTLPVTPSHVNNAHQYAPKAVAMIYDDSVNPLMLQSQSGAHFGVLLTKHDGSWRQWWVTGEKSIVRRIVSNSAMPGTVAKESEMREYPAVATFPQLIFMSLIVVLGVIIGMSFL